MADRTIMNAKDAVSASLAECFETIGGIQLLQPLLIGLCARSLRELNGHGLRKRAWQTADQCVDDEHYAEQDQNGLQDPLDDVISHFLIRSFLARPEPR